MLTVCCVNQGNYCGLGAQYVNILFDSVRRNLDEGFEGRFVCFTDDASGLDEGIHIGALPEGLSGWWAKLYLFAPNVFMECERVLFLDLDTLLTGRLDEIASYTGEFAILRDFFRGDGYQSSVMAWRGGFGAHIWQSWVDAGMPQIEGGDQAWIERAQPTADIWQDKFPQGFVSYKRLTGVPDKASVVVFHGLPRPHEITDGWVPRVWTVGGISRADLTVIANTQREVYMANVRENCARDLPWLAFGAPHDRQVAIVGGAPSVRHALMELRYRQAIGQDIWALNNSYAWLIEHEIQPTAHFLIDARAENIEFLKPTRGVKYFLASQCHPSLFEALKDFDVTVIHMLTDGMEEYLSAFDTTKPTHLLGGGTTVAMKAMLVAHETGYRKIHLYGVDSSYQDAEHHAYPQALNDKERRLEVFCGERSFSCAPWMVTQAEDFQGLAQYVSNAGTTVTVNGEGLLPHVAREMMANPVVTAADIRAHEILKRLNGSAVGAEIGVFAGDLSSRLLAREDLRLYMVDSWGDFEASYVDPGQNDFHAQLSADAQERYMRLAEQVTAFAADRRVIMKQKSVEVAQKIAPASLDFVFIDADHSLDGCRADIRAWQSRVKPGGWLCGHDFANPQYPQWGVERAVREFVGASGLSLELGENFTWFVQMVKQPSLEAA